MNSQLNWENKQIEQYYSYPEKVWTVLLIGMAQFETESWKKISKQYIKWSLENERGFSK